MTLREMGVSYLKTWKGKVLLAVTVLAAFVFVCFFANTLASNTYVHKEGQSVLENLDGADNFEEDNTNRFHRSQTYLSIPSNLEEWNSSEEGLAKGVFCITTESYEYLIYNIDSSNIAGENKTLSDYNYIWVDSGNDNFYAVINVSGKNIDLKDYYVLVRDETGVYASRAVFNFYEAETIDLSDAVVIGTVLAPNAEVKCDNASVYGQMQCKRQVGEMKFYKNIRFTGYRKIVDNLNVVALNNETVRVAAIEYLINNNSDGRYSDYTSGSSVKVRDVEAIKKLSIHAPGEILQDLESDLAKFPNLEEISISGGNLPALSLRKSDKLRSLSITGTDIASLNISGAVNLERLVLDGNKNLKELDFTNNNKIQILSYSGTPLGWLDFSVLPELYYLDCSNSKVESYLTISGENLKNIRMLDISGNNEIQTFYINTFPNLEAVNCSRCGILNLDFRGVSKLEYFKGSYNRLKEVDFTGAVNLKSIEIHGKDLVSIDIRGLKAETVYSTAQIISDVIEDVETEVTPDGTEKEPQKEANLNE